jgi:hypothetical protein
LHREMMETKVFGTFIKVYFLFKIEWFSVKVKLNLH